MDNIIIVNDFDYVQGGATNVAIHSAHIFHNRGWNVTFFSGCSKGDQYPFKTVTLNDKEIANGQSKLRNIYNKQALKKLKSIINPKENYIVLVHGWTKSLSSSIFKIGKLKNVKVFLTLHDYFTICPNGGMFNYKKQRICNCKRIGAKCLFTNCDSRNYFVKLYRYARLFVQNKLVRFYKYLSGIISISNFSEAKIKELFKKKVPFYRVNNPIQIDFNTERSKPELSKSYVYVGRLDPEKGVENACKAAATLGFDFKIIGSGILFDELKNKYSKYGNISFLGWLKKNEVFEHLKNARALIFPSLWYEGAPLTIFEAMSFGIPCIISNSSAALDFVNKDNGYIYDTNNVDEMIECIKASYDDSIIKDKSILFYESRHRISLEEDYYNKLLLAFKN